MMRFSPVRRAWGVLLSVAVGLSVLPATVAVAAEHAVAISFSGQADFVADAPEVLSVTVHVSDPGDLTPTTPLRLRGTLTRGGQPVAKTTLQYSGPGEDEKVTTGTDGSFVVPPGAPWTLASVPALGTAPGAEVQLGLTLPQGSTDVALQLVATESTDVDRIAGANRVETAAKVSAATFPAGVDVVYVARADTFPDALAGGPAAATTGSPLLLTSSTSLPEATAVELSRLEPKQIVVLGGTASISDAVADELEAFASAADTPVVRLGGKNRYATAAGIASWTWDAGADTAYLATAANFPDALSGSAAAAHDGAPILLTDATAIPEATLAALDELRPARIVVLGGTTVVNAAVEKQLGALPGVATVDRFDGANRYETSAEISANVFGPAVDHVLVATGANFPDALAGGAAAAHVGGPLLLVQPGAVPAPIAAEIGRLGPAQATILGGSSVVEPEVAEQLTVILGAASTPVGDAATTTITPKPAAGGGAAPSIAPIADQTSTAGKSATLQVIATDPDGDALAYSATGLPPGLTIDASTGVIAGTVAKDATTGSPYSVTVTVSDGTSAVEVGFSWVVQAAPVVPVSFGASGLSGEQSSNPTSLEWGPDGRLYVAQQNGVIYAYDVSRDGPNDYSVTDVEKIEGVLEIANHNDDGSLSATAGRQVTGLLVAGTAEQPVLYVSSSDPRINYPGDNQPLDTNSGVLSKLTKTGASWDHVQLVRGLPRSYENHSTNGMDLDAASGMLYVMQGGHANMGGPSASFGYVPEYAYSSALLSVDLGEIEAMPTRLVDADGDGTAEAKVKLDLPTLADTAEPFGGQGGENMAVWTASSPVQVHSPGYRNAYDVVLTTGGHLYAIDNGPNWGWGDVPAGEGTDACTNEPVGGGAVQKEDGLHHIEGEGYYAGHPNPTRGNPQGAGVWSVPAGDGTSTQLASVAAAAPAANPVECDYLSPNDPAENGNLHTWPASTNGLAEYTASNFGGAMQGDLVAASFDGSVYRAQLSGAGAEVGVSSIAQGFGSSPLDVTTIGDDGPFPGTVWAATYGSSDVTVFEPADYDGSSVSCDLSVADADGDGYSNVDEIANGSDPCNAASKPADFDGDGVGNLTDDDDDDDGIPDLADVFPRDATNGTGAVVPDECPTFSGGQQPTSSPGCLQFENGAVPGTILDLGFTGVMLPPTFDQSYEALYSANDWIAGGAANIASLQQTDAGDAWTDGNDQKDALQFGISSPGAPFTVATRVQTPFDEGTPSDYQAIGVQIGDGTQASYVKLVVNAGGGEGGVQLAVEEDDLPSGDVVVAEPGVLGNVNVILALDVDPTTGAVAGRYSLDEGATFTPAGALSVPTSWFSNAEQGFAVGLIATHNPSTNLPIQADWTYLTVEASDAPAPVPTGSGGATVGVLAGVDDIDASTYDAGAFVVTNTGEAAIASVTFDLSTAVLPDLVFDPEGTAGDTVAKDLQADSGKAATGQSSHAFGTPSNGTDGADGYRSVTVDFAHFDPGEKFAFSADNDPTSIKGTAAPGPHEAGSVSGLELAGSSVTVEFADGTTATGDLFADGSDAGATTTVTAGLPAAPDIALSGAATPTTVAQAAQQVVVSAPAGATVHLLQVEAGLFLPTDGEYAGTGYDIDPYEANSALSQLITTGVADSSGAAAFDVTLQATHADGGRNRFLAIVEGDDQIAGRASEVLVVDHQPATST